MKGRKGVNNGSTLNLLLKNSFKNTVASWPVVLGLTLLIALLSLVISLMTSIGTRVVDNYHDLNRASNIRQALVDLGMNDLVPDSEYGQNNVENQQAYIYKLEQQYASATDSTHKYDFYWSRTEGRNFQGVFNGKKALKIKIVAKTTPDTSKESVDSLAISEGKNISYDRDETSTTAYKGIKAQFTDDNGKMHTRMGNSIPADHPHDVVLDATFAKKNHVKIGDIIRVQEDDLGNQLEVKSKDNDYALFKQQESDINKISDLSNPEDIFNKEFSTYNWLQVVGFGESSDYTMPVIDSQTPMPNKSTELIAYVNPHTMGLYKDTQPVNKGRGFVELDLTRSPLQVMSASDEESYYSMKFVDQSFKPTTEDINRINKDFLRITGKNTGEENSKQFVYLDGDKNYEFASRTSAIRQTMKTYETIAGVIFAVVAIIVIFSVVLVSKKQIDKSRSQIGVMKALGYQKRKIVWNYVTMPFISALVGGIVGFIIAQAVQNPLISLFNEYFNLDISGWSFDVPGFIIDVVAMWFVVTATGFGIAYWVMRADTLELLSAAKASHISWLGMKIKNANRSTKITPQMESALLASNSGKMFSVTVIVLIAALIMTAAFNLPTVLNQNKTKSYTGIKYKQVVQYNDPIYNNPYTFMKTWDPEVKDWNFHYSKTLNKLTATPLADNGDGTYNGYDYSKILSALSTGKLSSEYYDLEFGASPDTISYSTLPDTYTTTGADGKTTITWTKQPAAKDGSVSYDPSDKSLKPNVIKADELKSQDGTPNALQGLTANMKMLQMNNVVLSSKYFKQISDWAIKDSFGWNILANQWPSYMSFTQNLRDIYNKSGLYKDIDEATQWKDSYLQLQNFYKKYIESVGLTVTRDYYNYDSNVVDDSIKGTIKGVDLGQALSPEMAYKNHDYPAQIAFFNKNGSGKQAAQISYQDEVDAENQKSFGGLLAGDTASQSIKLSNDFRLSDGIQNPSIAINHIYTSVNKNSKIDHYLSDSPDKLSIPTIKQRVADYLAWYGSFFSERSGTAIVQAGYSRPPYFVQQYMKKAYYANDDNTIYRFGFSSAPYNPDLDQLGTEISANATYNNKETDFKIYGIQDNNRFVDLKDTKGNDLIKRLYDPSYNISNQYDIPAIVVNQSLATKLNLKEGQEVNWGVLYQELQKKNKAYSIDDWKQPNPRMAAKGDGWISENDMDTFNVTVNDPGTNNGVAFTAGNTNLTNAPSDFYTQYLNGDIYNKSITKGQTFKIIGIHDGYGTPAAWIKNSDAENVLHYDQARKYMWDTLFRRQFGDMFANYSQQQVDGYVLTPDGTNALYTKDPDNADKNVLKDYNTFQAYLNTPGWLSNKKDLQTAQRINNIFNNAYPIYNYKYSLSDDIGDLQAAVSTWDETGGYSPIEENGGFYQGKAINAIGKGALSSLQPVEISKQILNQLSSVIMAVVIIIIVLVIVLAFIIIMLTTSLIISDNVRFIATMKVLGYSTVQIVNTILGMYAIAIVCAYVIGFIAGWFILSGAVHSLAMSSTFVLPLLFPWWLIFAVMLAVIGIYVITFAIGFYKIQKTNPLDALKNMEI